MRIVTGIDFETTGLEWEKGERIIEIAAIVYDLASERQAIKWVQRLNPQKPITAGAQAVHGIKFEDVAFEPLFADRAPQLLKILKRSDLVIAHNGNGFDKPFLEHELRTAGLEVPSVPWLDTMLEGRWATPFGKLPNLGELCFACGVNYDPLAAHAAEYDVERMMECFFTAYKQGFYKLPSQVAPMKEAA